MTNQGFDADRAVSPADREAIANLEVGHTDVTPGVARTLVVWFLVMLAALPLIELIGAARGDSETAWSHLRGLPDVSRSTPGPSEPVDQSAWSRLVTVNRAVLAQVNAFETALEDQSVIGRALRPRTQLVLSRWLGAGNERVYVGRDGWLFYRPDVEYVTGRGFLDARQLRRRTTAANEYERVPEPDPRPAIRQFKRDLEARGITLVLMPTPVKPTIQWSQLARGNTDAASQNPSYAAWMEEMKREGVLVFDPTGDIGQQARNAPQYLVTDTHWRPETMQRVAEALAAFVQQSVALPSIASPAYDVAPRAAQQIGDTAAMLDLPRNQSLYPAERVTLRFVMDKSGEPWRPARDADILVLGDSFTNMYSLATMGWGEAAGLVEQLSYTLQRPVDRIVQNDDGAYATREVLRRELDAGTDRLAGKRLVIWQFAARELAFGDWRVIGVR
jgi:hypothetical protein